MPFPSILFHSFRFLYIFLFCLIFYSIILYCILCCILSFSMLFRVIGTFGQSAAAGGERRPAPRVLQRSGLHNQGSSRALLELWLSFAKAQHIPKHRPKMSSQTLQNRSQIIPKMERKFHPTGPQSGPRALPRRIVIASLRPPRLVGH